MPRVHRCNVTAAASRRSSSSSSGVGSLRQSFMACEVAGGRHEKMLEYAAGFTVCSRLLFASIEQLRFHARRLIGHTALMHKKLSLLLRVMMQRISECDAIFFGAQQNPTAVSILVQPAHRSIRHASILSFADASISCGYGLQPKKKEAHHRRRSAASS